MVERVSEGLVKALGLSVSAVYLFGTLAAGSLLYLFDHLEQRGRAGREPEAHR